MLLSGGLRSSKSSHCFHQLFCGVHVFTGNQDTPRPYCAKRTEERAESTGQGSAAPPCCCQTIHEGGQLFSLSSVNPHKAKSRGAETTVLVVAMGLAHLTLLVVEDAGRVLLGFSGAQSAGTGLFWLCSSPGKSIALSVGCGSFCCHVQMELCVCSPVSPGNHCLAVTLQQNTLLHFNIHSCARLERTAKNLRLSQVQTITIVELI